MRAALFSTMAVATIALASPLAGNDSATTDNSDTQVISEPETTLNELQSTVKLHTANINKTLSVLQNTTTTATTGNFTNNGNITGEFNLIALALYAAAGEDPPKQTAAPTKRSSRLPLVRLTEKRDDNTTTTAVIKCDGKCQLNVYQQMGDLTSEIAYTVNGAMQKNAVDLTSSTSVLIKIGKGLGELTSDLELVVGGITGVVVKSLQAALGVDVGGALATLLAPQEDEPVSEDKTSSA